MLLSEISDVVVHKVSANCGPRIPLSLDQFRGTTVNFVPVQLINRLRLERTGQSKGFMDCAS